MREEKKTKFPCDNCRQYGHWKYQPMCPNYSKHLETMQQAAVAYSAGQGRVAAAAGGAAMGSAVVPFTGIRTGHNGHRLYGKVSIWITQD
jgi:hypothetical protein